jgi:transcription termination factor Rho
VSTDQQMERSLLLKKERAELQLIAQAMSLPVTTRARKGDIIDAILRAAGVEPDAATEPGDGSTSEVAPDKAPPVRTRRNARSAPASNGSTGEMSQSPTESASEQAPSAAGSNGSEGGDAVTPTMGEGSTLNGGSSGGRVLASAVVTPGDVTPVVTFGESADGVRPRSDLRLAGEPGSRDRGGSDRAGADSSAVDRSQPERGGGDRNHQGQAGDAPIETTNRRNRRRRGRGDRSDRGEPRDSGYEAPYSGELIPIRGLIDLREQGFGFVRANGYLPSSRDVYVSQSQVKRFGLRKGDFIDGASRPPNSNETYGALVRLDLVNSVTPDAARGRPRFEDLTPLFPDSRLRLEVPGDPANMTARIVELLAPIGKGQRGLIVSPPKAGKTTVLKQIAHSIEANHPEVHLMVLLVDERPEEVTDMRRTVKGEVVASTFDRPTDEHTQVAELAIERAKRMVELGQDVVIILDGITRLARAYNLAQPTSGRVMSGGVDSGALYPPKKFFGAARNIEEGGSLTILATALVETGSKMDEVIFEEFKGTGNMELRLDRKLAERRTYPAIDVNASSTRHEELLYDRASLSLVWRLRRVLNGLATDSNSGAGLELLMERIKATKTNAEFLADISKSSSA